MAESHCERIWVFRLVLNVMLFSGLVASGAIVTRLPGFNGDLPFSLETGYIGVGESEESQLFYYFVKSGRSPTLDPLVLVLTGGPGCSALSPFFYVNGPLMFDYAHFNGSLPPLELSPYSWSQNANIIYVDAPAGTGFSYSTTKDNYYVDDHKIVKVFYQFLRKWLVEHPQYLKNQLFIFGDSYNGLTLPILVQDILNGNEAGLKPHMNLKGYILGNPGTDSFIDDNSRLTFAHRLALIPTELYEYAKATCNGDFVNIDAKNTECVSSIDEYQKLIFQTNVMHVLEPTCQVEAPAKGMPIETLTISHDHQSPEATSNCDEYEKQQHVLEQICQVEPPSEGRQSENPEPNLIFSNSRGSTSNWCRDNDRLLSTIWANDKSVQEALHVRENTITAWKRCNVSLAYTRNIMSTFAYHHNLTNQSIRVLIYSGDHDLTVPYIGTQNWIHSLNLTKNERWRAWFVDGQVGGYTERFSRGDYRLTFATVKDGGHAAPEYKRKECFQMVDRFLNYYPL
ncbi:serine carboxypeptidase-like 17 [Tripterygium wilfordii]|uniref:serine carboxypeptidase-like 17 n=1 Tax=Tripterygium wilfordii TaxID=458696 RepID=UPI0018F816DC|nr:serine carboxypeptidase-like 17 [Tripterygium wilfordii]